MNYFIFWALLFGFIPLALPQISSGRTDLIDLSFLDYFFEDIFDWHYIVFRYALSNTTIKIRNYNKDQIHDINDRIHCNENKLIQFRIELSKNRKSISTPFNASCQERNYQSIQYLHVAINKENISLNWKSTELSFKNIRNYIIHYSNNTSNNSWTHQINGNKTSFVMKTITTETTWHQICLASIDYRWSTSMFLCVQLRTTHGILVNIYANSSSNKIKLSWQIQQWKYYDDPIGYVVNIHNANTRICRIITMNTVSYNKFYLIYIIKFIKNHYAAELCNNQEVIRWDHLQTLEIYNLTSYSQFNINISIIYTNYLISHIDDSISVTTKQGESDAVQNLAIQLQSDKIWISFNPPDKSNGIIIKYRIRFIMRNIDICTNITHIINETEFIDKTQDWISIDHLPKCRSYLLEISAVNGWTNNNGVGKSSFQSFRYPSDNKTKVRITPTQISSNSLSVIINHGNDTCDSIGYIVELINENNPTNCDVRIICTKNCCDIISQHLICPNKQCQLLSNKSQQSIDVFFIGLIQEPMKYLIKGSSVSDIIHDAIQFEFIPSQIMKDCFTDCHVNNKYFGMRSADRNGKSCIPWKGTSYEGTNPNICSFAGGTNFPWCYTEGSKWDECDIPVCSTVPTITGCITINQTTSSTESLTIKWKSPTSQYYHNKLFGYITLLHNNDHSCTQYHIQLCNNCGSHDQLSSKIKNIYSSCGSPQINNQINLISHFNGLHQNQQYIVYIIPIVSLFEIGEVRNVTIHTKLAKPITPQNIRTTSQSFNTITLSWDKENDFTKHGQPDHYLITVLQNNSQIIEKEISIESIDINNLDICSRYCFLLRSANTAGKSEISEMKCWNTLAPKPDNVKFTEIQSGYFTKQTFSWKYLGQDKCSKKYRLMYQMNHEHDSIKYLETNQTSITIDHLQTNVNYTITIQAENHLQTIDNEHVGEYSESKQFYTGLIHLNLSYYNEVINSDYKSLNISWGIIDEMRGALFQYLIIVSNYSRFCIYSINFQCDNCRSPWNLNSLNEDQTRSRNHLIKCQTEKSTKFNSNDTSFHYLIKSESVFSNFSVEIYGIYLLGIYPLNQKTTVNVSNENRQLSVSFICIGVFLIILIILL